MNVVIKMFIVFFLYSLGSYSQTKDDDAFYILNNNHQNYIIVVNGLKISNVKKLRNINSFRLYNRNQYEKREEQVKKDKKKDKFNGYQFYNRPKELIFNKIYRSKIEVINHCDTHFLNLVNYKWIEDNSWKENNPNVLFKDLFFLLKIEKDKYLKFKVERTIIAY